MRASVEVPQGFSCKHISDMEKQRYQTPELAVIEIQMENSTLNNNSPGGSGGGNGGGQGGTGDPWEGYDD